MSSNWMCRADKFLESVSSVARKILEHSARIECEIPNGFLTPVECFSLIDKGRCRDAPVAENLVISIGSA